MSQGTKKLKWKEKNLKITSKKRKAYAIEKLYFN